MPLNTRSALVSSSHPEESWRFNPRHHTYLESLCAQNLLFLIGAFGILENFSDWSYSQEVIKGCRSNYCSMIGVRMTISSEFQTVLYTLNSWFAARKQRSSGEVDMTVWQVTTDDTIRFVENRLAGCWIRENGPHARGKSKSVAVENSKSERRQSASCRHPG